MVLEYIELSKIFPYENNPRKNQEAIEYVAKSIKEFGFKVPVVIDKNNIIVCGHTRYEAAQMLKMDKIPCVRADDLDEDQIKAFRLADNKVSENSLWDIDKLNDELEKIVDIDMESFGFLEYDIDWDDVEDLDEDTYEKPEKIIGKCPHCGTVDSKNHYKKVECGNLLEEE